MYVQISLSYDLFMYIYVYLYIYLYILHVFTHLYIYIYTYDLRSFRRHFPPFWLSFFVLVCVFGWICVGVGQGMSAKIGNAQ